MILQPRRYVYKTKQKKRTNFFFTKKNNLKYGTFGILILNSLQLTSKQIFRFFIFLKKTSRKTDKTKRQFWFNVFPHLPLTRKPKGVRMGKGIGKLSLWFTKIRPGTLLVEFTNLRLGRAKYFSRQLTFKLNTPSILISETSKNIKLYGSKSLNVTATPFYLN